MSVKCMARLSRQSSTAQLPSAPAPGFDLSKHSTQQQQQLVWRPLQGHQTSLMRECPHGMRWLCYFQYYSHHHCSREFSSHSSKKSDSHQSKRLNELLQGVVHVEQLPVWIGAHLQFYAPRQRRQRPCPMKLHMHFTTTGVCWKPEDDEAVKNAWGRLMTTLY